MILCLSLRRYEFKFASYYRLSVISALSAAHKEDYRISLKMALQFYINLNLNYVYNF